MASTPKIPTYAAPALEKGFNVIELLADHPRGLSISEIATALGLSMSEIFRIIMVMERREWLHKGGGDRYRVTTKVLELAFRATPARELVEAAVGPMGDLAKAIIQSCHLVVRNGSTGLVVFRQETPGPTAFSVRVGSEVSLEATCSGHVLLAFNALDNGQQIAAPLPGGILGATLQRVRARGYEMMKSGRTLGVTDISFPIFGAQGLALAALTVPFLQLIDGTQSVDKDVAKSQLQTAAARISEELGSVI